MRIHQGVQTGLSSSMFLANTYLLNKLRFLTVTYSGELTPEKNQQQQFSISNFDVSSELSNQNYRLMSNVTI